MRRKLVLAIVALIGLGSLAALGSSPEFIRSMVEAVQTGSIASVFTAPAGDGPDTANIRQGAPDQTAEAPEIPEKVLWQIVFTVADGIVAKGRKAGAKPEEARLLNNYFTRQGKLSAESDAVLKDRAARYLSEVEPIDKRAGKIIEEARAKFTDAEARRKNGPPAELGELQRQRDEITLRHRDEFRNTVGEDAYSNFSAFLKDDFLKGAKSVPFPGQGDQLSPEVFLLFTIIIWDDGLIIPLITGIGGTVVDFFDGFYYDPWVGSELYNWSTGASLHIGTDKGYRWLYPALVFHPIYPTTRGYWYCNYTLHLAYDRYFIPLSQNGNGPDRLPDLRSPTGGDITAPEDAYYLGELEVCHRVQDQCEGVSGAACQTPTPTPTPSPTPIEIKTVGFTGDYTVVKHTTGAVITDPTWTRGSATNAENVVAYAKDTSGMKMDAKFDVNPPPPAGDSIQAKVQAKYNGQVIAATQNNTTVTQSTFEVTNLQVDRTKLEATPQVKKGNYSINWEVTVDNGQTWRAAGSSSHIIYWTLADPVEAANCSTDGIPRNCMFTAGRGNGGATGNSNEYPGLYDYALEYAITGLTASTQTPDTIAKQLAYKIDDEVIYDPDFTQPEDEHPLRIPLVYHRALCSSNANLLQGLLRSIGIDSEAIYFWGGKPDSPVTPTGGKVHFYHWTERYPDLDHTVSLRAKRPKKNSGGENIEKDPHFTFHSMVKLGSSYYDPSYGKDVFALPEYPYSETTLTEILYFKDDNINKPRFKKNQETAPFVVRALTMEKFCIPRASNNNCAAFPDVRFAQNTFCDHSDQPRTDPWRTTSNFDSDGISDLAVWRPSDGIWYVINSNDQSQTYSGFGLNGDKPVPADYDGDGITDLAVFRPSDSTWYIMRSSDNGFAARQFGVPTDRPLTGDFDGDSKSDIVVWRPVDGDWYWLNSSDDSFHGYHFGSNGDVPVSGDYDGDRKTDFVVFRPSNGTWYVQTGTNYTSTLFGLSEDIPVTGDFDFDTRADIAVYRPSTRVWYISQSSAGFTAFQFGDAGDIPSTGDYNNDGGVDPVVWTPSTGRWRVLNLENGSIAQTYWGTTGDIPVPSSFNR